MMDSGLISRDFTIQQPSILKKGGGRKEKRKKKRNSTCVRSDEARLTSATVADRLDVVKYISSFNASTTISSPPSPVVVVVFADTVVAVPAETVLVIASLPVVRVLILPFVLTKTMLCACIGLSIAPGDPEIEDVLCIIVKDFSSVTTATFDAAVADFTLIRIGFKYLLASSADDSDVVVTVSSLSLIHI